MATINNVVFKGGSRVSKQLRKGSEDDQVLTELKSEILEHLINLNKGRIGISYLRGRRLDTLAQELHKNKDTVVKAVDQLEKVNFLTMRGPGFYVPSRNAIWLLRKAI